jgi:hypothetical protein
MTEEQAEFIVAFVTCDDVTVDVPTLKAAVHAFDACLGKSEALNKFISNQAYAEACRFLKRAGHEAAADALWAEAEKLNARS